MIKKLLPIFISVFVISVNVLCADASENILRGVEVKPSTGESQYTIDLISTEPARMNKTVLSENRIILNLKGIHLVSNLSTKFNGQKNIENIMVEPCGADSVNIMLQGDNIVYSNIEFKSPTSLQIAQDSIKSSFTSLLGILSGTSLQDRSVQVGIFLIFLSVLIGEVLFVKSKYKELQAEKEKMIKDISLTSDFQDYLPTYNRAGLKKPYTTPIYANNIVNTSTPHNKTITPLKTKETVTLNSLLYNKNREDKIIDRIVNNKPVFGALSNINFEGFEKQTSANISSPIEKAKLKANIRHLEEMTAKYKENTTIRNLNDIGNDMYSRLNRIY